MDPHKTNWIFGLITIVAVGFAFYTYLSKADSANPIVVASIAPSGTPTTATSPVLLTSPTPKASTSPASSPVASASPSTTTRTFSATQPLSMPNEIEKIESGGSLFSIAQAHEVKMNQLAEINGITDANTVFAGQSIIIPDDVNDNTFTFLFVTNTARRDKEKKKIDAGGTSLYTDAVTSAQTDTKGIYGLKSDTPYSKSDETETAMTLSTSDDTKIVTLTMNKDENGLWFIKKMTIKVTKDSA